MAAAGMHAGEPLLRAARDSPIPNSFLQDPVGPGSELAPGAQWQLADDLLDERLWHHRLPVTDRLNLQRQRGIDWELTIHSRASAVMMGRAGLAVLKG